MKDNGKFEFHRREYVSFFDALPVSLLENKSSKSKVSKVFVLITFSLLFLTGFAQETHNLEIIWQKASPSDSVFVFGRCIASGDVNGDSFSDIMIVGDSVLHSANPDSFYRGECWVYLGGTEPDTIPDIRLSNLQKLTYWSLHSTDINGDGFDDVILGACNNGPSGQVLVYLGGNPMDTICDYQIRGPSLSSVFGCSVSSGDVNGDSFNDLIVGAYTAYIRPGFNPGRVYIYFGGPSFDTIPDVILDGGHQGDYEGFGTSVGGGGDVNSDGYQDIIVGAANFGPSYNGRIYIYFGGNPVNTIADVSMIGEGSNQQLGWSRVDFLKNLDDFDYATASTSLWPRGGGYCPGKIYVLFGGDNMDSIPDIWMIGKQDSSSLGTSTSSAGDLNQDFSDEIISGAPTEYDHKGTAYIWLGGSLLDTIPDAWIRGETLGDRIGFYVSSAGDVNSDGKDEIMVSNYAGSTTKRVWVCKYTGPGIEEHETQNAERLTLEIKPNPAKSQTAIRLSLTAERKVSLKVYDITGKIIKVLDVGKMYEAGQNEIKWDLRDDNQKKVATGVYFIEIKAEDKMSEIKKITVVK